jgi:cell division protein FtsI/penicillin-binding protein 2
VAPNRPVPRRLLALAAGSTLVLAACSSGGGSGVSPPQAAAARAAGAFTHAWGSNNPASAARQTDAPTPARRTITALDSALEVTRTTATVDGAPTCRAGRCEQKLRVTQDLAGAGAWSYRTTAQLRRTRHGRWLVHWTPQTFQPDLTAGTTLLRSRSLPPRAPILDRSGRPLTRPRPVVRIGVVPAKVERSTYADLAHLLGIDATGLRQRVAAAQPDWFVDVITLRRAAYAPLRSRLLRVPGIVLDPGRMSLAPTSSWGRAVLGVVEPATAETLKTAGPLAAPTDQVGASGLQAAFQRQLAGTPSVRVDLVDRATGKRVKTLYAVRAVPGRPLRTTLDYAVQSAAEKAVSQQSKTTALVAVQASTGDILAAVNGPALTSYNTAFVGHFPPGSTFKVVSYATMLNAGVLRLGEHVSCPDTTVVGGKQFKNYLPGLLPSGGSVVQAFAQSCNTTVIEHAPRIGNAALPAMARRFGVGAHWDLGLDAYSGQVPTPASLVERAADMIGQGRVLESPLGMAMIAAAVGSGRPMTPTLLPEVKPGAAVGRPLPGRLVGDLRTLMRAVVTQGTGLTVNLPGLPVSAKTGTAEYGAAPTRTDAWMIGFRGNLAFAVIVVNGTSGAHDAGPVVTSFLDALPRSAYR